MEKNNMSKAKIAIILLNYNDSRFLIDVVFKIAGQKPDEFIIVDDRSTDRSLELMECFPESMNIKVVKNDGVHSPFGAFVKGCESTDAEFVACFSADDYPNPGYLDNMRKAIKNFPLVDVYMCNTDVIREGETYQRTLFPFIAYISPDYAVKIFQAGYAKNINQCGIVIKREWVQKCWYEGGKDTEANFDCMYSFSSIFEKGFVNIEKYLTTYRSFPNSFCATGGAKKIKQAIEVHKKFFAGMFMCEAYSRAKASGMWGVKARWLALIALWGIMKLPKWARIKFYNWFYQYDQRIEKL